MTAAPRVWTFFYGSYINFEVLQEVDLVPQNWEVARLAALDAVLALDRPGMLAGAHVPHEFTVGSRLGIGPFRKESVYGPR